MKYNTNELLNKLKNRVNELEINFDKLTEIVKEHKILLSGSFLLQVITDKIFNQYDIDLFIFGNRNLILENKINDLLAENHRDYLGIFNIAKSEDSKFNKKNTSKSIDYEITGINSITSFCFSLDKFQGLNKIQLIYMDDTRFTVLSDCIKNFDFDICMNYWNGKKIFINHPKAIQKNTATLFVNNMSFVLTQRQEQRINKYKYRNYDIIINFTKLNITYNTLVVTGHEKHNELSSFNLNFKNVMILYLMDNSKNIQQKYSNLSNKVENLIVYKFGRYDQLDNLPINLKKLIIYDENGINKRTEEITKYLKEKYSKIKIPFGCELLINDNLLLP